MYVVVADLWNLRTENYRSQLFAADNGTHDYSTRHFSWKFQSCVETSLQFWMMFVIFWIRNWSHIATILVVVVVLVLVVLVGATILDQDSVVSHRIAVKFDRIVLQVNTHYATLEGVGFSLWRHSLTWRQWRHFVQRSAAIWWLHMRVCLVPATYQPAARQRFCLRFVILLDQGLVPNRYSSSSCCCSSWSAQGSVVLNLIEMKFGRIRIDWQSRFWYHVNIVQEGAMTSFHLRPPLAAAYAAASAGYSQARRARVTSVPNP